MMENYKKLKPLGQGSFGTVYLVQDSKGDKYAMKKIRINPFSGDDILKEITVMRSVLHQNLIRVFQSSYNEESEQLEIIMEYCEGGDLLRYFSENKKSLQPIEILKIFRQIVKGFIALNVKGIMHRDLKPENVLIKKQMTGNLIKIADFGCARNLNADKSKIDHYTLATGTALYASPEQLTNLPYSSKCDVWSGGCMLYLLTFGEHPFKDSSVQKTILKIKNLTQGKEIILPEETDSTLREILKLMLVYEDKERATWRELWLRRFFNTKLNSIPNYLMYLQSISNIANWIIKEFWRLRKSMNISSIKNEVFAYFIVKFQYSNMLLAKQIAQLNPLFDYLFTEEAYVPLKPTHQDLLQSINNDVDSYECFFEKIKETLSNKDAYNMIQEKEMIRRSSFADLDHSIRASYKILLQALPALEKMAKENGETSPQFVWVVMARWLNFEYWFSFQRKPRVQEIKKESSSSVNILKQIHKEIDRYNYGIVE